ncbi:hypothetical protein DFQ26_001703 [Actinomortierella ambigua]|nr:hypothetical protein DFQ26_001703 [Actinomortierella ambigua]
MLATNPSRQILEHVTKSEGPKGGGASTPHNTHGEKTTTGLIEEAQLPDPIFQYCTHFSTPLPVRYAEVHQLAEQEYSGRSAKSIPPLQAQLLKMLAQMTRPKKVLELGCFMGYSAMALADGMDSHGVVYTCEKDAKAADLARRTFAEHHYTRPEQDDHSKYKSARIELLEGNAKDSLTTLAQNNMVFDIVFIDADKSNSVNYYEFILKNNMLSRQGFMLADNTLFQGLVLNSETASIDAPFFTPSSSSSSTGSPLHVSSKVEEYIEKKVEKIEEAALKNNHNNGSSRSKEDRRLASNQKAADHMHRFNHHVFNDGRVEVALLPIFDGLSIIRRVD